ncbi:MAG: hypothetical protein CMJ83_03255 [Planctomycetes bacterium]|nr:hypothetical protein [Planctomycetota bacterium]
MWIVVALALLIAPLPAQLSFRSTVTFGDSLTANSTEEGLPARFARLFGKDPMEAVFDKARGPKDRLKNYAAAGSVASGIPRQFTRYLLDRQKKQAPEATFVSYQTGGNDIMRGLFWMMLGPPGKSRRIDKKLDALIARMRTHIDGAGRTHPKAVILVWTIPDITIAPGATWVGKRRGDHVRAHITRVNDAIKKEAGHLENVVLLDLEAIWKKIQKKPPVIMGRSVKMPPASGERDCFFADHLHPSALGNVLLANHIIKLLNRKFGTKIPSYTEREIAVIATK